MIGFILDIVRGVKRSTPKTGSNEVFVDGWFVRFFDGFTTFTEYENERQKNFHLINQNLVIGECEKIIFDLNNK